MSLTDPLVLLVAQIALSFLSFGLAARRLARLLAALPADRALTWLLWVHVFRYVPLGLLAPGQVSRDIPLAVLGTIAVGDALSALLALLALASLSSPSKTGRSWVWLFSMVSVADIVGALVVGLGNGVYRYPLGSSWYVLTLYVPLVCVSQVLILMRLLQRRSHPDLDASRLMPGEPI